MPRMYSTGDEIISGPFGGALGQERSFNFDEASLVKLVAHDLISPVPE